MTSCRYHCRACGGHFTSLEAFDAHRSGSPQDRACTYFDDAGLAERLGGTCSIAGDHRRDDVVVYSAERAQRATEYFGARNGRHSAPANAKSGRVA